jgi:threonine aldolase
MPPWLVLALRSAGWKFYTFIGQGGCRLMCAWDTTEADVRDFVTDIKRGLVDAPRDVEIGDVDHRKL